MQITDPLADMLTRVRNAQNAGHLTVKLPYSRMNGSVAKIMHNEGYVADYKEIPHDTQSLLELKLKEGKVIKGLKRISKPGLRVYAAAAELPRVLGGLGIAIISTNKGVMTDKQARRENVGGEVLAFIW